MHSVDFGASHHEVEYEEKGIKEYVNLAQEYREQRSSLARLQTAAF